MYTIILDYALFFIFLLCSTLYPLWGGFRKSKNETKANYVFASGQVSVFAMMLSIARGTLGVRAFLGKFLLQFFSISFCYFALSRLTLSGVDCFGVEKITISTSSIICCDFEISDHRRYGDNWITWTCLRKEAKKINKQEASTQKRLLFDTIHITHGYFQVKLQQSIENKVNRIKFSDLHLMSINVIATFW